MEIHIDLVGGLAGDMFIAALLDAFPEHEAKVLNSIGSLKVWCSVTAALLPHSDGILSGKRFSVTSQVMASPAAPFCSATASPHSHAAWKEIRRALAESALSASVKSHALGIFALLAQAEASVHGIDIDAVAFHEVGAWDSIADVVGAAVLIDAVQVTRSTFSPIPLGSGRVNTAHGILPVPAPATARLLLGMPTIDDGIAGERVTPTGAAICRYLAGAPSVGAGESATTRRLVAIGMGFGTRRLPGISNHTRVLCFDPMLKATAQEPRWQHREIEVIEFEVDDQSGEDLAAGLEHLRAHSGVLDVIQCPVFGKKGRIMTHVRVLVRRKYLDAVIEACFRETTTIGLRHRSVDGVGLERQLREIDVDGQSVRVKVVKRPGGRSAKTEAADVADQPGHSRRASLRTRAESDALVPDSVELDV